MKEGSFLESRHFLLDSLRFESIHEARFTFASKFETVLRYTWCVGTMIMMIDGAQLQDSTGKQVRASDP
jgi:hypothetical protein